MEGGTGGRRRARGDNHRPGRRCHIRTRSRLAAGACSRAHLEFLSFPVEGLSCLPALPYNVPSSSPPAPAPLPCLPLPPPSGPCLLRVLHPATPHCLIPSPISPEPAPVDNYSDNNPLASRVPRSRSSLIPLPYNAVPSHRFPPRSPFQTLSSRNTTLRTAHHPPCARSTASTKSPRSRRPPRSSPSLPPSSARPPLPSPPPSRPSHTQGARPPGCLLRTSVHVLTSVSRPV